MPIRIIENAESTRRLLELLDSRGEDLGAIEADVQAILEQVKHSGDAALLDYTSRFDGVEVKSLRVPEEKLKAALRSMDRELLDVVEMAASNIRRFHQHQVDDSWSIQDDSGTQVGQRVVPMERVGLYVPGGTASYPSTVLMNAIPAQLAGVREIALVSPPGENGLPNDVVLATACSLGIEEVYSVGGAQAVAALAFGTESIPRVDKIVGPGNAWVAAAKKAVFGQVDIDSIAGPSEIAILADESANPDFVAADMLSQAEHDTQASAILVTTSRTLAETVAARLEEWIPGMDRQEQLVSAIQNYSAIVVAQDHNQAIDLINSIAPEHLEIMTQDLDADLQKIKHAGAIFLGPWSSEPLGDYIAGPNHVLPTGRTSRYASALGVYDFVRRQSVIRYTKEGVERDGPHVERFAKAEGLPAHASAIAKRRAKDE